LSPGFCFFANRIFDFRRHSNEKPDAIARRPTLFRRSKHQRHATARTGEPSAPAHRSGSAAKFHSPGSRSARSLRFSKISVRSVARSRLCASAEAFVT